MKVKEFMEEHEKEFKIVGAGIVILASGIIGYKIGCGTGFNKLSKKFGVGSENLLRTAMNADSLYSRVGLPDDTKFKDLCTLAQRAIDFDPSHLDDIVTGVFVTTKN